MKIDLRSNLALFLLIAANISHAQDAESDALPSWYLAIDNDGFALGSGSDEFYSQGLQLGYSIDPEQSKYAFGLRPAARWLKKRLARNALDNNEDPVGSGASWFIGQAIFTPGTLKEANLLVDDRPYAGWLYLGARIDLAYLRRNVEDRLGVYHSFELQLGVIGPLSNAEWSQTQAHRLVDDEIPQGWDNQLPNEFGVFGRYMWQRGHSLYRGRRFMIDLWPQAELAAGNVQTYLQGGGVVRFGYNLGAPIVASIAPTRSSTSFPIPPGPEGQVRFDLPSRTPGSCFNLSARWAPEECFAYLGAVGRVSVYNAFLDGTAFHDSHSVDKRRYGYDLTWGFRARWRDVQIDYSFIHRSQEFSPVPMHADNRDGGHQYGSLSLRCLRNHQPWCPGIVALALGLLASAK